MNRNRSCQFIIVPFGKALELVPIFEPFAEAFEPDTLVQRRTMLSSIRTGLSTSSSIPSVLFINLSRHLILEPFCQHLLPRPVHPAQYLINSPYFNIDPLLVLHEQLSVALYPFWQVLELL